MASPRPIALVGVGAVLLAYAGASWATGVDVATLAGWLLAALIGWVLPGVAIVRVVRSPTVALPDQLAWAMPVGLALVLLGWAGNRLLDWSVPAWAGGLAVAAILLSVPLTRRRMARPSTGWGLCASTVVVVSLLVTIAWGAAGGLAGLPNTPGADGFAYSPDAMFHVAMTGELGRVAHPGYPMVAGEPISYHWFYYAAAAQLGLGLDTPATALRLFPLALLLATVLMVAAVARLTCGGRLGPAAAAVGAALAGIFGNTQATLWIRSTGIVGRFDGDGGALDPIRIYWQHSPTTSLGWVMALAAAGVIIGALRQGESAWWWAGVLPASILAAGSKASNLPLLVCGLLLVALVSGLRRDRRLGARSLICAALVVAAYGVAATTIYGGGSYGLRFAPGYRLTTLAEDYFGTEKGGSAAVAALLFLMVNLLPTVPRLLGLAWLVPRRVGDPAGWLLLGAVIAGYLGTNLTGHPGHSEVFFLVSAYPVGLAGSAAGFALLGAAALRSVPRSAAAASLGVGLATALAGLTWVIAASGDAAPSRGAPVWVWVLPGVAAVVVAIAALALSAPWWRRSGTLFAMTLVGILLVGGLLPTAAAIASFLDAETRTQAHIADASRRGLAVSTEALIDGAQLIRDRGTPTDVVASNRACRQTEQRMERSGCDPRDFTVSAYTGLRTDVTGWAYADRTVSQSWNIPGGYTRLGFWDPQRLAEQHALISSPTPSVVRASWDRGVRWILADDSVGSVSADLGRYGEVCYDRDGIVVVRLHEPE